MCHVEIHSWCCAWLCKFTPTWNWPRVFTRLQRVLVTEVESVQIHWFTVLVFNFKMFSSQYTNLQCKDEVVMRLFYLCNPAVKMPILMIGIYMLNLSSSQHFDSLVIYYWYLFLTHWGQHQMADIFASNTVKFIFLYENCFYLSWKGPVNNSSSVIHDWVPNR